MKRGTTLFLKTAVFVIGLLFLALCIFGLPWIVDRSAEIYLESAYWKYPIIIGLYAAAIPFSFALYQTLKLLSCISKNKACSELAVKALRKIKYCAATISVLYVIGMPLLFLIGHKDDAPGIVALGLLVILASLAIAVFTAVLQKRYHR